MKVVTLLLSFLIFFLSLKPCSDGNNIEDKHTDEISLQHNHGQDADDSCPITCICNCCGMAITYEPLIVFKLKLHLEISKVLIPTYQSSYQLDFYASIWQPPQLIS